MASYLETIYFRDEYDADAYPQKLCDYLIEHYLQPHAGGDLTGKRILDVGSGKGNHLLGFSRRGMGAYGIDKRDECLDALPDFDVRECNLEEDALPFPDAFFDFVYSKSVIEHVWNADNFISESFRVLRPGGLVLLMTPDWGTQYRTFWDDYTHVKAWTRKGLQNSCLMHGFEPVKCILFRQLPLLWRYPLLEVLADVISILPESSKWRDAEESDFRTWVRFSKEKMLLATGVKPSA